jgi:RHS repeat-associated protein
VNPANNQLSATTGSVVRSYGYDAAGHAQGYGTNSFTYNNRGRMMSTSAASTNYLYNELGQMIEKSGTLGTTIFVQDEAGHLIGEYDGSGNLIEETIWLGDIPVATLQPNGSGGVNIFYVHTDHLNTPRKIAQPSTGTLAWRWDADPFGATAPNQNPGGLGTFVYGLRFPGQYYQAETGLNQNVNRDYDPLVGKYVESDPIGLWGGSYSTYAYANENPLSKIDPRGLAPPGRTGTPTFPTVIPPAIAIPGSPENQSWVNSAWQQIDAALSKAGQAIHDMCMSSEDKRCQQVLKECRRKCLDIYVDDPNSLPGTGSDMQGRLRRCTRECMEGQGCHNF